MFPVSGKILFFVPFDTVMFFPQIQTQGSAARHAQRITFGNPYY